MAPREDDPPPELTATQVATTAPCWRCGGKGWLRGWCGTCVDCTRCDGSGVDPER